MENYDEKMNYSFEPVAPETPQPPLEQAKEEIRRSGKHTGLKIAALLAAVAIIAGVGGSVLTKTIDAIGQKNLAEQEKNAAASAMAEQSVEQEQPAAPESQSNAAYRLERTPLPETLKSNEGDKTLTPAQVYKMNIGAVCGISTQVTADLWGVETTGICTGSGFVLTEDGYIVTNHHVIADADEGTVVVQFYSGEEYPAAIVGTDSMNDVALLKIEAEGLQTVTVGDSDEVEVGETVEAIGNPLGDLTFTMTAGYISALDREIDVGGTMMNLLQTNAAVNPGNSGGGLFNMSGELVGIVNAKSSGENVEGLGFAIPSNDASKVAEELMTNGYVTGKAYIGVSLYYASDSYTAYRNFRNSSPGLYIAQVVEGYNDDVLKFGDRIIAVDGTEVSSADDVKAIVKKCEIGSTMKFSLYRDGKLIEVDVKCYEYKPEKTDVDFSEVQ